MSAAFRIQIELIAEDMLSVSFPYDKHVVADIKRLARRKWNPLQKRWEVHLSHLAELMERYKCLEIAPGIREKYEKDWTRQTPVQVELGVLEGKLIGPVPAGEIDEATSFAVAGAEFSHLYKKGRWDGRRHLFSRKKQTFPSGLWPRVQSELEARGIQYEIKVIEKSAGRKQARINAVARDFATNTTLRPYQAKIIERALEAGRGIIQIGTGGGKTLVASKIIERLRRRTIFFVHTLDLLYQAARVFERELGEEIGILGDGQARLRTVTVATVQTAARLYDSASVRVGKRNKKQAAEEDEESRSERVLDVDEATQREISLAIAGTEVVIFDECHHVPAELFYKLAMKTRAARWRFGLSATPWREDGHDLLLEAALGPKICEVSCSALIDQGYLIAPQIEMRRAPGAKYPRRGAYAEIYQAAIVENRERNCVIAAQVRGWAGEGRSVLVLVAHVAHGRNLEEMLPEAVFCWGGLDGEARQRHLKALEQKLAPIMIATTLADEGLDVPTLGGVILAGGGKSATRAFQRIGRALRPAPGKCDALILDFFDDAPFLREHSQARLELYRQEPRFAVQGELPHPRLPRLCPTAC